MKRISWLLIVIAISAHGLPKSQSIVGSNLYFISPNHGETVSNPVTIKFGLKGMGVAPAGVDRKGTGHHHLLIDIDKINYNQVIPNDSQYKHFGNGQTETQIELPPGEHTLQLLLGDARHIPHEPPVVSKKITIHVK